MTAADLAAGSARATVVTARGWFVLGATLTLLALLALPGRARQEPTTAFAGTPSAMTCRTEARSFNELQALFVTPVSSAPRPTPGVLPRGVPADPEATTGITATVHELVACFNAGALLRAYGLYTDDYLRRLLARQGPPARLGGGLRLLRHSWRVRGRRANGDRRDRCRTPPPRRAGGRDGGPPLPELTDGEDVLLRLRPRRRALVDRRHPRRNLLRGAVTRPSEVGIR